MKPARDVDTDLHNEARTWKSPHNKHNLTVVPGKYPTPLTNQQERYKAKSS